jgi:hypothetical protein
MMKSGNIRFLNPKVQARKLQVIESRAAILYWRVTGHGLAKNSGLPLAVEHLADAKMRSQVATRAKISLWISGAWELTSRSREASK